MYDYDNYPHHTINDRIRDEKHTLAKAKNILWLGEPVTSAEYKIMQATHESNINKLVYKQGKKVYTTTMHKD